MKRLLHILLFLFFPVLFVGLPTLLLVLSLDGVQQQPATHVTAANLQLAKHAFSSNQLASLESGSAITLKLNESQLKAIALALQTLKTDTHYQLSLQPDRLNLTLNVPVNILGSKAYLNVQTSLLPGKQLRFRHTKIGQLSLPTTIAHQLLRLIIGHKAEQHLRKDIHTISIHQNTLSVTIEPGILKLKQWALGHRSSTANTSNITHIQEYLIILDTEFGRLNHPKQSLAKVLQRVFNHAYQRTGTHSSAKSENEAAIAALAIYFGDRRLARFYGIQNPPINRTSITLARRTDWMKHFIISAGVTLATHEILADAVGLLKELQDAKTHSGFSFTDLAADRAGIYFATYATQNNDQARHVQLQLRQPSSGENLIFPNVKDLPEWLKQAEFDAQFGSLQDPRYRNMMQSIQKRIKQRPLYQRP